MKKNFPITGVEVTYASNEIILSTTNTKGAITYVNDSFVKISGFANEELIGKNHNLVRHPDMPSAAFEDLWLTLKAEQPWMGIVKNRCANGDHYWVDAFVTPIHVNGVVTEYQSVRTRPKRETVDKAESVYNRINAGKSTGAEKTSYPLHLRLLAGVTASFIPLLIFSLYSMHVSPLIISLAFLVSLGISYTVMALQLKPLNKLVNNSQAIVSNKLMQYIYTGRKDEFGQIELAMKVQNSKLSAVVGRFSDTTKILMRSVEETAQSIQMTNQGVQLQKEELDQAATAMNQMTASISDVSQNTRLASESAIKVTEQAAAGKKVVEQVKKTTHSLAAGVNRATEVLARLNHASNEIGTVVDVINGIAQQTNLLALNAAIEAARAGEQGRGFAVVADEVRTLASRTQQSTIEIQKMVEQLQAGANEAVDTMQQGTEYAAQSIEQTDQANQIFESVMSAVDSIRDMSVQIASAVSEQSHVAEEINQNIVKVSQGAEKSFEAAQKTASSSQLLIKNTEMVERLMNEFNGPKTKTKK